ncbi:hypothetical protein [Nocardioides speluncae]|uniref:hypothetical protein n=1 Tax=Nocardioides speluncae TaxID=2670337 RepID=UPI0012B16D76|nr:hypothetical protein [Nocardioides speluncae]
MRRTPATLLVALSLTASALSACGDEGASDSNSSEDHQKHEWRVAGDPDATADEIIDAGSAASVATSGGQTLVTYRVESDDDEGPQQGAWRLYDDQGEPVADEKLGQVREQGAVARVRATDGGFLLESYTAPALLHVAADGTTTPVEVAKKPRPVQAGDLLVQGAEDGNLVYRPSDNAAYQLPKLPTDQPQRIAIDEEGVVWVVLDWADDQVKLAFSPGGTGPWTKDRLAAGKGGYPVSEIHTGSGRLTLVTGHGGDEYPVLDSIWTRPAGPGKVAWQSSPLTGADGLKALDVYLDTLSDGRLLLEGDAEGAWLQQASGDFAELKLPDNLGFFHSVSAAGDRLYTTGTESGAFLVSDDFGESWDEFER